jgi:hypothetical protein
MVIDDRDAIRRALLIHKFQAKYDVLRARENLAAIAAWGQVHTPHKATMDKLPKTAFRVDTTVSVNAGGYSATLRYGGGHRGGWYFAGKRKFGAPIELESPAEGVRLIEFYDFGAVNLKDQMLIDEVQDILTKQNELDEQVQDLDTRVQATLAKFTTFEALEEAWPEIETFVQARMKERGIYVKPQLPAVLLIDLTKDLELPPEEISQAA